MALPSLVRLHFRRHAIVHNCTVNGSVSKTVLSNLPGKHLLLSGVAAILLTVDLLPCRRMPGELSSVKWVSALPQ